jgi:hypothetical protein
MCGENKEPYKFETGGIYCYRLKSRVNTRNINANAKSIFTCHWPPQHTTAVPT